MASLQTRRYSIEQLPHTNKWWECEWTHSLHITHTRISESFPQGNVTETPLRNTKTVGNALCRHHSLHSWQQRVLNVIGNAIAILVPLIVKFQEENITEGQKFLQTRRKTAALVNPHWLRVLNNINININKTRINNNYMRKKQQQKEKSKKKRDRQGTAWVPTEVDGMTDKFNVLWCRWFHFHPDPRTQTQPLPVPRLPWGRTWHTSWRKHKARIHTA